MTSEARRAEAERATVAYHLALTQLGAATVEDALRLWAGVPPTRVADTVAVWLTQAIHLVMTRRGLSRDLAMAYYRLARALRTGRTVADPRRPEPPYVTLDLLRREFAALASTRAPRGESPTSPQPDATQPRQRSHSQAATDDEPDSPEDDGENETADRIIVEEIAALDEQMRRQDREAEREARILLDELGPANLRRKLKAIDDQAPATEVDQHREEAHRRAGTRQAAAAERIAVNGARSTVWAAARKDRRAVGYVRLSRTGTPCGWCAMLISRGAAYRSERSATYSDGDKYHDHCHCIAEPIFSYDQYADSALTALNRQYAQQWPQVTRGLSGKAAVSAWRRFIRAQQQAAAQEARQSGNVQEA